MTARRPSRLLHRSLRAEPPIAVAGEGLWLIDRDGRRYADACGGAALSCLGHGHPAVIAAVRDQLARLDYIHTSFFSCAAAEELAEVLVDPAPEGRSHAFIVSGGSEAIAAGSGAFAHGQTYLAHPVAFAAALAVQRVIRDERLVGPLGRHGARARGAPERAGRQPPECRR